MNVKDIIDSCNIITNDMINYQMRCVVNKYLEERISNPKKKVDQIANEIGVSVSTLNRYKKDLGFESSKKHRQLSPNSKREVVLKSLKTKAFNKAFKEEVSELNKRNLSAHEYASELDKLHAKFERTSSGKQSKDEY